MKNIKLHIDGMSCSHCLNAVNKALNAVPGVHPKSVQIGRAELEYDDSLNHAGPDPRGRPGGRLHRHGAGRHVTAATLGVTLVGAGLIAWIQYYFFVVPRRARAVVARSGGGLQELDVVVSGGYQPALIEVKPRRPVRLNFTRQDPDSCLEEVVFGEFGIREFLPLGQKVPVEFTPETPGEYEFTCGMGMFRGKLRVKN